MKTNNKSPVRPTSLNFNLVFSEKLYATDRLIKPRKTKKRLLKKVSFDHNQTFNCICDPIANLMRFFPKNRLEHKRIIAKAQ